MRIMSIIAVEKEQRDCNGTVTCPATVLAKTETVPTEKNDTDLEREFLLKNAEVFNGKDSSTYTILLEERFRR